MMVHIHGFDWANYSRSVMPAIARWLIQEEIEEIQQLYFATRSAQEDQHVPEAMKALCAWPRALDFVKQLPRGPFARREYQKLCIAEQFLILSDQYVYRHPPQLYRESEALRTIWGACIEQYCLPWYHEIQQGQRPPSSFISAAAKNEIVAERSELLHLLRSVGLAELAARLTGGVSEQKGEQEFDERPKANQEAGGEDEEGDAPKGIFIGRLPTTLHLRGWLATQSLRAMVYFEYLACGRRAMPFGRLEGDPFGSYVGYLTPDEVQQMCSVLQNTQLPSTSEAEQDYHFFRQQAGGSSAGARLIDEILPAHARELLQAIQNAAEQQIGLICTIG